MKAIFFVAFVTVMMLVAKTTSLFANTQNCTVAVCSNAEKKGTGNKTASNMIEFDTIPFIILIPCNNF